MLAKLLMACLKNQVSNRLSSRVQSEKPRRELQLSNAAGLNKLRHELVLRVKV